MILNPSFALTEKECQILTVMVQGDIPKMRDIAATLNISEDYAYQLVRQLKMKLGVQNTAALIRRAIQLGVISPDGDLMTRPQPQKASPNVSQAMKRATDNPDVDEGAAHTQTGKSSGKSTFQSTVTVAENPHGDGYGAYDQTGKSSGKSTFQRTLANLDWLTANPDKAGLTALIVRAIQDGTISLPQAKERLIIDWLQANPDKAHLSNRKIATLIGNVSHTHVRHAKLSYQQMEI